MSRDRELFALLEEARWLSTGQILRRFFAGKTANAVNKRLRKLVAGGYLRCVRRGMALEQWYRLGSVADTDVQTPSRLPSHLEHFSGINDARLWAESLQRQGLPIEEFSAEWELKTVGQAWPLVPDGIIAVKGTYAVFAVEVDCDTESPRILASKLARYAAMGADVLAVLIVVSSKPRLKTITKVLVQSEAVHGVRCLAVERERLNRASVETPLFADISAFARDEDTGLVSASALFASPHRVSRREERLKRASASTSIGSRSRGVRASEDVE